MNLDEREYVNRLFYGDNLEVLRKNIAYESVDFIYLDPPFNSNRSYNVIFNRHDVAADDDAAQIQAFDDAWRWTPATDAQYEALVSGELPNEVAEALTAFRTLLGENDAMAYLVNMAPRLVELHGVLKPTGSLYLHCDPTMSHYLKILLDSIFGAARFRSEVIWKRSSAHSSGNKYGPVHDVIFFYTKSEKYTWNKTYQPLPQETIDNWYNNIDEETGRVFNRADLTAIGVRDGDSGATWRHVNVTLKGRHWAIPGFLDHIVGGLGTLEALDALDSAGRIFWPKKSDGIPMVKRFIEESKGIPAQDVIIDISPLNNVSAERLGYPTQKPVALLERLIESSSNPGDVVLDPFAGCGTSIDAAQKLDRNWIGIDVTYIAVDLIEKRLSHTYGEIVKGTYTVSGIPKDKRAALALFSKSPLEFERWAATLLNAQPNKKQVADKGIDGVARFGLGDPKIKGGGFGKILISVKGGKQVGPEVVRDLLGTIDTQKAEMGVLITNTTPTRGVVDAVNHSGTYRWPANGTVYPKVQVVTVGELLTGKRPELPGTVNPYIEAQKKSAKADQPDLFS
jgi:DNA modification methylase